MTGGWFGWSVVAPIALRRCRHTVRSTCTFRRTDYPLARTKNQHYALAIYHLAICKLPTPSHTATWTIAGVIGDESGENKRYEEVNNLKRI